MAKANGFVVPGIHERHRMPNLLGAMEAMWAEGVRTEAVIRAPTECEIKELKPKGNQTLIVEFRFPDAKTPEEVQRLRGQIIGHWD